MKTNFRGIFRRTPVKTLQNNVIKELRFRFRQIPPAIEASIRKIEKGTTLQVLHKAAFDANSMIAFVTALESEPQRMSLADQLRLEGYLEGYPIGRAQSGIVQILSGRFGDIPPVLLESVGKTASMAKLHKLNKVAWSVSSLAEFATRL